MVGPIRNISTVPTLALLTTFRGQHHDLRRTRLLLPAAGPQRGFADPAEFWRHLQLFMAQAGSSPAGGAPDRAPADATGLYDPDRPWRFDGLRDAAFRTGTTASSSGPQTEKTT